MAKMYLYNGLEFPELPNDVDRTVWDFACITEYKEGQANHLLITKSTYKDTIYGVCFKTVHEDQNKGVFFYGNDTVVRRYEIQNGEWVFAEERYKDEGATGVGFYYDMPIWTNTTIRYDTTENVFLEASDPIPVSTFDLKSWLTGFALGLAGKPLPMGTVEREPVAYLYNGVRLPALPELTGEYLTIAVSSDHVNLSATDKPWIYKGDSTYGVDNATVHQASCKAPNYDEWTVFEVQTDYWRNEYSPPEWTNYDLALEDGTILRASEPVPVYE